MRVAAARAEHMPIAVATLDREREEAAGLERGGDGSEGDGDGSEDDDDGSEGDDDDDDGEDDGRDDADGVMRVTEGDGDLLNLHKAFSLFAARLSA